MKDDIKPSASSTESERDIPNTNDETFREPVFKTPEEYSEPEEIIEVEPPKKEKKKLLSRFKNLSKKQRMLVLLAIGIILIGITYGALALFTKDPPAPPAESIAAKPEPEKPTTEPSRLTGVQVKPELNKLPVTAVMIENSPDARPQSGLRDAGVVFEAIAEGGITRFLTLFQEAQPGYIGPVRSVRPYYLDWVTAFDAPIAHAGGSAQALAQLRSTNLKDLEAFQNPNYYQRVSTRFAPHNLYTSRKQLLELQKTKGWTSSNFTGFIRKEKEEPLKTPLARTISLNISGFNYNPSFTYNPKTNGYLRKLAGEPHKDEKSKKQIEPKVVVVMVISRSQNGIYSVYKTIGKGTVYIFQDGNVQKGTWSKTKRLNQITFSDSKGKTIGLNAGQTWITAVADSGRVAFKP